MRIVLELILMLLNGWFLANRSLRILLGIGGLHCLVSAQGVIFRSQTVRH